MLCAVCGPICESGDVFGTYVWRALEQHSARAHPCFASSRERPFPVATQEGDVVVIDAVGAYGRCMSSQYNMRPAGDEVFLRKA